MKRILLWVSFCCATMLTAESVLFDAAENLSVWGLNEGREFPGATGKVVIGETGKVTLEGSFKEKSGYIAGLFRRPLPLGSSKVEFVLTAETPVSVALRILDAKGRFFQNDPIVLKPGMKTTLALALDSAEWKNKWGGPKDLTDPVPIQPFREIFVNVIRPHGASNARVRVEEIRIVGPEVAMGSEFTVTHPLHLLLPDSEDSPKLKLRNFGRQTLELAGTVTLTSFDEKKTVIPLQKILSSGEAFHWPLPIDRSLQGVWTMEWRLTDRKSGRQFSGAERFGQMIPAGTTPDRTQGYLFGICTNLWISPVGEQQREIEAAALCGAKVIREQIRWSLVQPKKDEWKFEYFDRIVNQADKLGIEIQTTLLSVPRWAIDPDYKPIREGGWMDARLPDYDAFREFAKRTAERYKGKIRYYEVFNEPDLISFANYTPEKYLEIQSIAFDTIKAIDSEARILNGGISSIATDRSGSRKGIMTQILTSGTCDIFAFHGHGGLQNYLHQMPYVQNLLNKHPMPWYANETAISSTASGEHIQARTLFQKFLISWAESAIGYNWYNLRNNGFDPKNGENNFGLITNDFKPKAAYLAFNTLATHFREATFEGEFPCTVQSYRFRAENKDLLLTFWNNNPAAPDQVISLGGITGRIEQIDLMGNRRTLPTVNGELLLHVTPEPFVLRISGQESTPEYTGNILVLNDFSIDPGTNAQLTLPLKNTTKHTLKLQLTGVLPDGVSGNEISASPTLRPGETQTLTFRVHSDTAFRSYAAAPKRITFTLKADGFAPLALRCPVLTAINIPTGKLPEQPTFVLNTAEQVHVLITYEPSTAHLHWTGPEDLSAEIRLARNGGKLLLEARVTDDVHFQKERGFATWQGDNIQFAVKLPTQNDFWEIGLTHLGDGTPEVFVWRAPNGFDAEQTAKSIRLTTNRDEMKKQTIYRAEIPFEAIGLNDRIGQDGFRFNLIVNDNDGEIRESFIMVAPGIGADKDTTKYPLVRFQ